MTATTIQSNRTVSNKLETSKHYESHSMEKTKRTFWATQYLETCVL